MEHGQPPTGVDALAALPALPTPDHETRRREASHGASIVLSIVVACVATTSTVLNIFAVAPEVYSTLQGLVWAEAVVALVCLCGLLFGDPGVVKRSAENCLPQPPAIAAKLAAGEPSEGAFTENVQEQVAPFRNYCVRCYVYRSTWTSQEHARKERRRRQAARGPLCFACGAHRRDPEDDPEDAAIRCCTDRLRWGHHCRTCARCVEEFDHHCGVFGRCIAGKGFGGNMGYFKVIILCAYLGPITTIVSVLIALISEFGPLTGFGASAGMLLGVCCATSCCGSGMRLGLLWQQTWWQKRRGAEKQESAHKDVAIQMDDAAGDGNMGVDSSSVVVPHHLTPIRR